jgi:hypothetical protein
LDGRVDAAMCCSTIPEPLAELYARVLLRALRAAANRGATETKEQGKQAAKKCPPSPPVGLVQLAVSESVQQYVLVGGKPVSLDDDYARVCEAAESPRTRRAREEWLVKEAAEADAKWRQLADAGDWTAVRAWAASWMMGRSQSRRTLSSRRPSS